MLYRVAQSDRIEPMPTVLGCWRFFLTRPAFGDGAEHALLYPGSSDVHLLRDRQGIINLDAQIPDGAFYLCMPEQELYSPEISGTPID